MYVVVKIENDREKSTSKIIHNELAPILIESVEEYINSEEDAASSSRFGLYDQDFRTAVTNDVLREGIRWLKEPKQVRVLDLEVYLDRVWNAIHGSSSAKRCVHCGVHYFIKL